MGKLDYGTRERRLQEVFVNTLRVTTSSGHVVGLLCLFIRRFSVVNNVAWY
jgi:hypothetical protein